MKNDSRPKNRPEPKAQAEVIEAFETFWHTFPKQIGRDAAFAAYTKAVQSGAESEAINRAAKLYALAESVRIEREGTPRYTMHPANWIKAGRYKDPPPHGTVIDQDGNVVAIEQEQDDGSADGVFETCQKMAAAGPPGTAIAQCLIFTGKQTLTFQVTPREAETVRRGYYGRRIHVSIKQPLGRTGLEQQVVMADVIFRHVPRGKPSLELNPNTTGIQLRQAPPAHRRR